MIPVQDMMMPTPILQNDFNFCFFLMTIFIFDSVLNIHSFSFLFCFISSYFARAYDSVMSFRKCFSIDLFSKQPNLIPDNIEFQYSEHLIS